MLDATLSSGWQAVCGLQHYLENNKWLDASAFAAEEALSEALDALFSNRALTNSEVNRSFHSRWKNRRRRNRQRENLAKVHVGKLGRDRMEELACNPSVEIENADFLEVVEMKMDAGNFNLLKRIAADMTYSELAVGLGMSEASLRTKVCRARAKARTLAA